jgi:hypothetical protein
MCFLHEGYESPYYAGINLLIMASACCSRGAG